MNQLEFLTLFSTLWCITISAPSTSPPQPPLLPPLPTSEPTTNSNLLKASSDIISMEGLNYLLRTAGNFFRPPLVIPDIPIGASHIDEYIQPPPPPPPSVPLNHQEESSLSSTSSSNHKESPKYHQEKYNFHIPLYSYKDNNDNDNKQNYSNDSDDEKTKLLSEIFPPDITNNNEPNYYEIQKPKKIPKKYSSTLKLINVKVKNQNQTDSVSAATITEQSPPFKFDNHRYTYDDSYLNVNHQNPIPDNISQDHNAEESRHQENTDNDYEKYNDDTREEEEQEAEKEPEENKQQNPGNIHTNLNLPINFNNDGNDRIQYQVHGYNGPKSYKFGYDTGKTANTDLKKEITQGT